MQEVDALVSAQRVKVARNFSFHSSAAVSKIPAPYRGREGSAARSSGEDHRSMSSWQRSSPYRIPLPFIGDRPFAPFDARARYVNREFCQMGKVSFAPRPTGQEKFLNKNYEERKRQEGYDAGSVRMANGWGCNCLRPKGKGCDGSKPCPEWVDQRF